MLWVTLFAVNIAQGLFLIILINYKNSKNVLASRFISIILALIVMTNLGYLIIRTELVNFIPQIYGLSFSNMFLFGPLFYFYTKSLLELEFNWKKIYILHIIPYMIHLSISYPFLIADNKTWIDFVNSFLSGSLPISLDAKIIFAVQDLHFFSYLLFTFFYMNRFKVSNVNTQFKVSLLSRVNWLKSLIIAFTIFLLTVFALYIFVMVNGKFNPLTNNVYTMITSGIVFYIAFTFAFKPELISPDFLQKYKSNHQFNEENNKVYLQKLKTLLEEKKLFLDANLKLATLADELELPAYQVSRLINENFGKSFSDLVNEYRVKEFIIRVNSPEYNSHSILGIALEVGFKTKSVFNTTFKKFTGKTPSEFKNY